MNPAAYGPGPQMPGAQMPAPAADPRKLLDSPAIRAWRKSKIYERTATVDEIDLDLAAIRAIRDRGKARMPIYLLSVLGGLGGGFFLAVAIKSAPGSPMALGFGVITAIVMGVLWAMEPTVEDRRLELLRGFMRRLNLEPGSQIKVKLDLAPLESSYKKKIDRDEGGWSVNYHHDDWLLVEGRLAGGSGVAFRYTRADSRKQAVHVSVSGNVRTTRTRTEGWFHDAIALRFAPDAFPGAAQLGPDAYQKLKLPAGFTTKHFLGQPGQLELTITSDRKWDAGPPGARLDGGDAVMIAGLWVDILFDLLGAVSKPFQSEGDIKPRPAVAFPMVDGEGVLSTITHPAFAACVLGIPGLLLALSSIGRFQSAASWGEEADRIDKEIKTIKDAKTRESRKKDAKWRRELESERTMDGIIQIAVGVGLLGAAGGGAAFGVSRRKKKAAKEAAEAAAAAPPTLPQGYAPAQAQMGYPQQANPQQPYPQQPNPGAPAGWPPPGGGGQPG